MNCLLKHLKKWNLPNNENLFHFHSFFGSRDKTELDALITDERLNLIIKNASLDKEETTKSSATFTNGTKTFSYVFQ